MKIELANYGCEELSFDEQQQVDGGALFSNLRTTLIDLINNGQILVASVPVVGMTLFGLTAPTLASIKNLL
ncbi:hypothetical protein [Chitinophaga caeni]|nr:hypothetical protein [Chitinophaga caeni]